MSSELVRRLRIAVVFFVFLACALRAAYYGIQLSDGPVSIQSWLAWVNIVVPVVLLVTYIFALRVHIAREKGMAVHPFVRAFFIFDLTALWLYVNIDSLVRIVNVLNSSTQPMFETVFACAASSIVCPLARACMLNAILCGVLILIEVAATLKYGPLMRKDAMEDESQHGYGQEVGAVYTTYPPPQPSPAMNEHYQQPQQQPAYYQYSQHDPYQEQQHPYQQQQHQPYPVYSAHQQQQQPLALQQLNASTPKYETQEELERYYRDQHQRRLSGQNHASSSS